ncbi:SMI1/KNR4 family protein [Microbacterium sp. BG28]|uniref:SMI1/KNR4 family protein n=1 Tax=Microbacterium sp. BG28 TaxID=3097356 RepID=UPI002A5AA7AE|nr:SMI1/KNR4 family protein [Microbacterium sp. BG28]MDY0828331.1 SMI1/KNR4 family protein [Microbacterium sp. BG28]
MDIADILDRARAHTDCVVLPPVALPVVRRDDERLPDGVREFYERCGGAVLFAGQAREVTVLPPDEVVQANPVLVGAAGEEDAVSRAAYLIARTPGGDHLTIDMSARRGGRVYDSFHELHGVAGSWPMIAPTFEGFLTEVWESQGALPYWLAEFRASKRVFPDAYGDL